MLELDRLDEAGEAMEEAVALYRDLTHSRPGLNGELATALDNLGSAWSRLGREREAMRVLEESLGIRRQLARDRPTRYLPELAMGLHNYGILLAELGRSQEALAMAREASDIYRRLAEERPEAFTPYLALGLHEVGARLVDLGRPEEALAPSKEALRRLAPFFDRNPEVFGDWMTEVEAGHRAVVEALAAAGGAQAPTSSAGSTGEITKTRVDPLEHGAFSEKDA